MDQEEIKILAAFKNKNAKAFAHIFLLHRKPLVYFADKILGLREEAEDIVSDSLMKLWARHTDFNSFAEIKSWLYITTRNACLDFLKYSKRVSASQNEFSYWAGAHKEEEILHIMYKAELLEELNREIELLPKQCRNIFRLAFFEGLKTNEIAARLGLNDQTVRNQKAKALHVVKTAYFKKNLAVVFVFCFSLNSHLFPALMY